MGRVRSALHLLRTFGIGEVLRRLPAQIHSRTQMLLFERIWDLGSDEPPEAPEGIVLRQGTEEDLEKIIKAWPAEFDGIAGDSARLAKIFRSRFLRNIPCFVAAEAGEIVGALWCVPWRYDKALPPDRRGEDAYEICNLFTTEDVRGKGVASALLLFALHQMGSRGAMVAYSRIKPGRLASIRLHEKLAFKRLGLLKSGCSWGLRFARLEALHDHEPAESPSPQSPPAGQKQMQLKPCVILAEAAVGSTVGMIRSIGSRAVPVYVLVVTDDRKLASIYRKSRYCQDALAIRGGSSADYVCEYVLEWLKKQGFAARPVLIPITDRLCTFVAECRDRFAEAFDICMPQNDVLLDMLDKTRANLRAEQAGLVVPQAGSAATLDEIEPLLQKVPCPVILKPTWWKQRGKRYFKAQQCHNKEQAIELAARLIKDGATILVQQYIPGGDDSVEVYMFYRSRDGSTIYGCSGYKLRQIPPGAGSMAAGRAAVLPHVIKMSNEFLERIDYRGLGGIEYKRFNDNSYFIEMSVRPEGFHTLAIKAGVDLPWLAYLDMTRGLAAHEKPVQKKASYITMEAYVCLWRNHRKQVPVLREIASVLSAGKVQFDLWSWRDPLPWLAQTTAKLKRAFAKVKRPS